MRELRRNPAKAGHHHPLLAIDCENDTKTGLLTTACVFGDTKRKYNRRIFGKVKTLYTTERHELTFHSQADLEAFIVSLKPNSCVLVFYNLSYDKIYLNNIIAEAKMNDKGEIRDSVLRNGTRVITFRTKNGLKAIDLYNHSEATYSLEMWIKALDMEAKYGIKKESLDDLEKRCMSDAKATYYLGTFIEDFYYNELGIPLLLTVGSNAMRLFCQKFFTDYWYRDDEAMSAYERQAYYGGRTEIFERGTRHVWSYDVNSTYLSIMRDHEFPDMSTGHFIACGINYLEYFKKYMGIYHCRVNAPQSKIMVLPVRIDGKLKFPSGEFDGYWTSVELQAALKYGYIILKCYDFVYYSQSKPYSKEFADFVWSKRKEYKAKGNRAMDLMIKKIGNTLYGKFGQRNEIDGYFGLAENYPTLPPEGSQLYNLNGEIWLEVKGILKPADFEFPAIAAFITSFARVKLLDGMKANDKTLIYCDTDCIKTKAVAAGIAVGKELGEWSFEGEQSSEFIRPKWYGEKLKGVPKRAAECCVLALKDRYINNEIRSFTFDKPLREREAIKSLRHPNIWHEVTKVLSILDDKRLWSGEYSQPIKYYSTA